MPREILTTEEVAQRLGASVVTVRKWVRDGQIPSIRVGGRFIRLDWEAVLAAIRSNPPEVQS